jgi:N-acetylglucosaminyldiphosphoundecaprenol N-acetyl-beta-D-mannosaminyltransferase
MSPAIGADQTGLTNNQYAALGIPIDLIDYTTVFRRILEWREAGVHKYVCVTPPSSIMMSRTDPAMRTALMCGALRVPDGIGIIIAAQLAGVAHRGRVSGPTLTLRIVDEGRAWGLRHYFYGGLDGCADEMVDRLTTRYPGLQVAGFRSPRFGDLTPGEDGEIINQINSTRPDLVWVGLGAPKQEKWMAAHLGLVHCAAMIGVGAAFDFHAGRVSWAPKAVRSLGLEWAYRFAKEPRRMWRRDLQSMAFVKLAALEALRFRLFGRDSTARTLAPTVHGGEADAAG